MTEEKPTKEEPTLMFPAKCSICGASSVAPDNENRCKMCSFEIKCKEEGRQSALREIRDWAKKEEIKEYDHAESCLTEIGRNIMNARGHAFEEVVKFMEAKLKGGKK